MYRIELSYPYKVYISESKYGRDYDSVLLAEMESRNKRIEYYNNRLKICKNSEKRTYNKKLKQASKKKLEIIQDYPEFLYKTN